MSFRACRLVVDTGLHAKRWTRDHALQWFATTNGSTVEEVQGEVARYCARPGPACGYTKGPAATNRLRGKADATVGGGYDYKALNNAVEKPGGAPQTELGRGEDDHTTQR